MPKGLVVLVAAVCLFSLSTLFTKLVDCLPQDANEDAGSSETSVEGDNEREPEPLPPPTQTAEQGEISSTVAQEELATTATIAQEPPAEPTAPLIVCDKTALVGCYIDVLDDWGWHLWPFRDNIAVINETVCEHHKTLTKCVYFPSCTRREILDCSISVMGLLTHRNNTGTFLKSYFLTTYTCTDEGMEMVNRNRECLLKNHISQKVYSLSTYIDNEIRKKLKLNVNGNNGAATSEGVETDASTYSCDVLSKNLNEFYLIATGDCNLEAAFLMCKSMTDAFVNIYPEILSNCSVACTVKPTTTAAPTSEGAKPNELEPPSPDGQPPPAVDEETGQQKEAAGGTTVPQKGGNCSSVSVWLTCLLALLHFLLLSNFQHD